MSEYTFTAYADRKELGTVTMVSNNLPSHLEICLEIVQKYPEAKEYNWIDLGLTPIDISKYVPFEFYCFLSQVHFQCSGKHFQYISGFHKGEKGEILGYHQDRYGSYLSVELESGVQAHIGAMEIGCITITD